jgi:hypothetical protein
VELANKLHDCDTHHLGTLHTNSKGYSCEIMNKKLEKGDLLAMENGRGIMTGDMTKETSHSSPLAIQMKQFQSPGTVNQ